jgi:ADP-ribose pyrophosphatase YjhB (NUDIX family)
MALPRPLIRFAVTSFQRLRKLLWFVTRPASEGVHALVLTPDRKLVLVRLTYADGWRLPGGGRGRNEEPRDAMLRELREEIGLTGHEDIRLACEVEEEADHRQDHSSIFVVTGAVYRARRSLEIDAVAEFDRNALPADTAPRTRQIVESLAERLG